MNDWIAAADLAGLAGMPITAQGVTRAAKRHEWPSRPRRATGGGREYSIDSLPPATRAALGLKAASRALAAAPDTAPQPEPVNREAALAALNAAPASGRSRADAKLAILRAFRAHHRASAGSLMQARVTFALAYNEGEIALDDALRSVIPVLSAPSLARWDRQARTEGIDRLAGDYGNRKGAGLIDCDEDIKQLIVGMVVERPHVSAKHVMRALRARFKDRKTPAYRTVQRYLNVWRENNRQTLAALENPDAWKAAYRSSVGNASEGVVRLNQRWETDSTPTDVMLAGGRHALVGIIDVYSRRVKFLVSPTSKSAAVAGCLRRAILDWGVPECIVTDNGTDYISRHITRVLAGLDIDHVRAPHFSPERKPFIERVFGTFTRDLQELCAGFVGHDVAQRKAIESRRSFAQRFMGAGDPVELNLTADAFQEVCDRWAEDMYGREPHKGLAGASPFQIAADWPAPVRKVADERALDILLAESPSGGVRTVQKTGIHLDGSTYIAPALEAHIRTQVEIRYDPADYGRIYVFESAGPFICTAECPERTGVSRREVASRTRERQKARIAAERRELKATARAADTGGIVEEILNERAEAASRVVSFPAQSTEHTTTDLAAAGEAAARPTPDETTAEEAARQEEFVRDFYRPRKPEPEETPEDRYARARDIEWRQDAGKPVDDEDSRWLAAYMPGSEYQSFEILRRHFAQDARFAGG